MRFEWDPAKNLSNIAKHGFSFEDAHLVFDNPMFATPDNRSAYGEPRISAYGTLNGRIVNIVFTMRSDEVVRIISMRKANGREKARYQKRLGAH